MNLIIMFIILNLVNVILQTVKVIVTIKCKKLVASITNAIAYGVYTVLLIYINSDLSIFVKVAVVALANLIGVYIVKTFEEKSKKDKLWKIDVTALNKDVKEIQAITKAAGIPQSLIAIDENYTLFSFYCQSQKMSSTVRKAIQNYNVKYFVAEGKIL